MILDYTTAAFRKFDRGEFADFPGRESESALA
jgi:hypothetical protein